MWKVPAEGGTAELTAFACGGIDGFEPRTLVVDADHVFLVDAAGSSLGRARVLRAPRE